MKIMLDFGTGEILLVSEQSEKYQAMGDVNQKCYIYKVSSHPSILELSVEIIGTFSEMEGSSVLAVQEHITTTLFNQTVEDIRLE